MPGQCYGCGAEFGVFKKEHGCKNCGFSFCGKCLHAKSIAVPKKNNANHHVCDKCYRILSGEMKEDSSKTQYELPQAYIKRMEALKEREGHKSVSGDKKGNGGAQKVPEHLKRLDKPDRDIAMRLERLKESDKPQEKVTNADITARLANLQGQPHRPEQKPAYQPPDRRLQGQQVDDLLDEIASEIEIDSQAPDPVKDVETRLNQLRHGADSQNQDTVKNLDGNNLNKATADDENKKKIYNKNIGQTEGAAGSSDGIDMEEIQRLMAQTASELEIDAQRALNGMQKDKELMERLKEVQKRKKDKDSNEESAISAKENSSHCEADDGSDSEDEDKAAKRIIQRYLEESKIDDNLMSSHSTAANVEKSKQKRKNIPGSVDNDGNIGPPDIKPLSKKDLVDDEYEDPNELPYCCICTEDAVIRCRDCDMDLYCKRCFRECHKEMEMTDHRTTPYTAPKGYH